MSTFIFGIPDSNKILTALASSVVVCPLNVLAVSLKVSKSKDCIPILILVIPYFFKITNFSCVSPAIVALGEVSTQISEESVKGKVFLKKLKKFLKLSVKNKKGFPPQKNKERF